MSKKIFHLDELFRKELAALLADEEHLQKALPLFRQASRNQVLAELLGRVESDASALLHNGLAISAKPTTTARKAVRGIIEEGQMRINETADGHLIDVELVSIAQRLLGYQLSAYKSVLPLARILRESDVILFCEAAIDRKQEAHKALAEVALHQIYWRASWWSPEHSSAWQRVKNLLREDWEKTKVHLGIESEEGDPKDEDGLPEDAAFRYGFSAGLHFRDREWNDKTRDMLASYYGGLWDERAEAMVRRGWLYARQGETALAS